MRKPLIAANWKMYKTPAQAKEFVATFLPLVTGHTRDEIVLCPSATSIPTVVEAVAGSNVTVGGQNIHTADEGAFTGETSALMLVALGVKHIIIGHSERRQYFGETDELVNQKTHTALKHGLHPIVCVGELLAEREGGKTEEVLLRQTEIALKGVTAEQAASIVIAYEPVWAIGTGKTATPEMAAEAHLVIRTEVARLLGRAVADGMRILYGGSVKPDNAPALLNQPEIDGALVGGASLDAVSFSKIVKY
ncbi:MAG: triose-phosphate isomerase [Acidobacteria bacterium]|jgi:triosephosphate isomerase|nr:triose-phosphate isomerase [Acidobacteriota bacterium]